MYFAGLLAQCPGSPKISPFPNLPDMSPKKVSATHIEYVFPLGSSKVFIILLYSLSCLFSHSVLLVSASQSTDSAGKRSSMQGTK